MTEKDLAAAGFVEDPLNPGMAIPIQEAGSPDDSWEPEQLAAYYKKLDLEVSECTRQVEQFQKAESIKRFRQGRALHLAHAKLKDEHGAWGPWLEANEIKRMTANRWERLFVKATEAWKDVAEEMVSRHRITELYELFDIKKKEKKKVVEDPIDEEIETQDQDVASEDENAAEDARNVRLWEGAIRQAEAGAATTGSKPPSPMEDNSSYLVELRVEAKHLPEIRGLCDSAKAGRQKMATKDKTASVSVEVPQSDITGVFTLVGEMLGKKSLAIEITVTP